MQRPRPWPQCPNLDLAIEIPKRRQARANSGVRPEQQGPGRPLRRGHVLLSACRVPVSTSEQAGAEVAHFCAKEMKPCPQWEPRPFHGETSEAASNIPIALFWDAHLQVGQDFLWFGEQSPKAFLVFTAEQKRRLGARSFGPFSALPLVGGGNARPSQQPGPRTPASRSLLGSSGQFLENVLPLPAAARLLPVPAPLGLGAPIGLHSDSRRASDVRAGCFCTQVLTARNLADLMAVSCGTSPRPGTPGGRGSEPSDSRSLALCLGPWQLPRRGRWEPWRTTEQERSRR